MEIPRCSKCKEELRFRERYKPVNSPSPILRVEIWVCDRLGCRHINAFGIDADGETTPAEYFVITEVS